jgi:hypothetical protein
MAIDGAVTMAGGVDRIVVGASDVCCVAVGGAAACSFTEVVATQGSDGAAWVGVEPVKPVERAAAVLGVVVEVNWLVAGCVGPVEVVEAAAGVAAAIAGVVVPESVLAMEVLLCGVDCAVSVEAVRGTRREPPEPVLPEAAALDPVLVAADFEPLAELLPWLLPPAEDVEPPACVVSAWASPEPLAKAAPAPSVTTPAASQVYVCPRR